MAYNLFGFSVSMSNDAKFLAVGIPGRSKTGPPANPPTSQFDMSSSPFNGAFRVYKLGANNYTSSTGDQYSPEVTLSPMNGVSIIYIIFISIYISISISIYHYCFFLFLFAN